MSPKEALGGGGKRKFKHMASTKSTGRQMGYSLSCKSVQI